MSRIEFHTGKLKKVDTDDVERYAREYLSNVDINPYDSHLDYLLGEYYNTYVLINNELYEYIEHEENHDSDTYFCKFWLDGEGNLNFISNFHNGGTCLEEMLQYGYKQFIENGEEYKES